MTDSATVDQSLRLVTIGEEHMYVPEGGDLTITFEHIVEQRDTITAEVTVRSLQFGELYWSRFNLLAAQARAGMVKALQGTLAGVGWPVIVEKACRAMVKKLREPEPAEPLIAEPPTGDEWLIERWIPLNQTTILYGGGGSGKSLLALSVAVRGILGHSLGPWRIGPIGNVLYLDWEADRKTHNNRLWGLTKALEQVPFGRIMYRHFHRPLVDVIRTVRADVDRHKVDFVITDSLAMASGPEPETADAAVRTLMALRSLPATNLVIGHVTKVSLDGNGPARPFGSIYIENIARSTIEARRQEEEGGQSEFTLGLYHRKHNDSGQARPIALRFAFGHDGISVTKSEPDMASASITAQCLHDLLSGPKDTKEVSENTGIKEATVKTVFHRQAAKGKVFQLSDRQVGRGHPVKWSLMSDREPFQKPSHSVSPPAWVTE